MSRVDQKAAYGILDVLGEFLGDIRSTLQDLDPTDADSVFDVRRDCHIRIKNIEGKLEELKKALGPDPLAQKEGVGMTRAPRPRAVANPFLTDINYTGEMTVRQLSELVQAGREFPKGLDTVIRVGDVEGNNGVNGNVCVTCHRPGDIVLSIDPNAGDRSYEEEIVDAALGR